MPVSTGSCCAAWKLLLRSWKGIRSAPGPILPLSGRQRRLGTGLLARSSPPWAVMLEIAAAISFPAGYFLRRGKGRSGEYLRLFLCEITSDSERGGGSDMVFDFL